MQSFMQGGGRMEKYDKLKCKMCLKIFYNTYHDWEEQTVARCPHCLHNGSWNLSEIDKMSKEKAKKANAYIYKKGDVFHLKYIRSFKDLVDIKEEDYI